MFPSQLSSFMKDEESKDKTRRIRKELRKMSVEERAEATKKNIEGKVQEAVGEVTGDPEDKAEGKVKQQEAATMHAKEDLKDKAKDVIDKA
jgi:uncharacterized protein YjbJ (UPF0337 family)